jgi:hypothetical protein
MVSVPSTTTIRFRADGVPATHPDTRKNRINVFTMSTNPEVKHLHLGRRKDCVFAPPRAPVFTLGVALHEIIFVV